MVARAGERRLGCGVIGAGLRVARESNKVKRASSGLWGNCRMYDGGAQWLQVQEILIGAVG